MPNVNGLRKYQVDEKTGTAEEILSFYPEAYLDNKNHPEYYISLNKEDIICEFIIKDKLGEGAFGSVRLGINKQTGEKVAIKILEKNKLNKYQDKIRIEREIEILKKLKHPNIVQLYGVIETERQILLIMEYVKGQELYQYILLKKKLSEEESCLYFQQIISGIEYLQKLKISHRDIKSENILIEQNTKNIKIIDFGLSNLYGNKENEILTTACGSPFYAPPEMLKGETYKGSAVDIWSIGVVLYAMICGFLPFEGSDNSELYKKIIDGKFSIPSHVSNNCRDLIHQMFITNPKKRITIQQIKKHQWVKLYGSGLNNNGEPIFNVGLFINKYIIPIDEDIIDEMEKKFKLSKIKIRIEILSNNHNDYTCLYYLMLKQKIEKGNKSISDLKSDLFLNYIKDKRNLLSNYKNNLKKAINARKMGFLFINEENINNSDNKMAVIDKNNINIRSQDDIIVTKNKTKIQKVNTSIYNSSFELKTNLNKNQQYSEIKNNIQIYRNKLSTRKDNLNTTPLKKTKSKIKFYNVNTKRNDKDIISKKMDKNNTNRTIKNNNQIKLEFNNNKIFNKIKPKIHSAALTPKSKKKQEKKIISKVKTLNAKKNAEISFEKKFNKTNILKIKHKVNNEFIKNENKTVIISKKLTDKLKELKNISEYKQEKNNYSQNNNDKKSIEKTNNNIINSVKNKNIYIKIEDQYENAENKQLNENTPKNNEITPKNNQFNNILNLNIKTTNAITDEKIKCVQTVDSFIMPSNNQEDYYITSNNNVHIYDKIVHTSPPKEKNDCKIINSHKNISNNKNLKCSKKKVNKAKLFKISKKTSSNIEYNNKIYKIFSNGNSKNNKIQNSQKYIINNSKNTKRNLSLQRKNVKKSINECNFDIKKNLYIKKDIKRDIKIHSQNLSNNSIKKTNINTITNNIKINNISSVNPKEKKNEILMTEIITKTENNQSPTNFNHKRFSSIDTEINNSKNNNKFNFKNEIINNDDINKINKVSKNHKKNYKQYNKITIKKIVSPNVITNRVTNKNKGCLNKIGVSSGFLVKRNDAYNKKKIFSEMNSQMDNSLNKNTMYKLGNINIKNKGKKNEILDNIKQYFKSNNNDNINDNDQTNSYQPFDLNCTFNLPKKTLIEKIMNILKNMKFKVKQIKLHKYNIIHESKKEMYELNISWNNIGIIKFKRIKGINNEYINNFRKIIYRINK